MDFLMVRVLSWKCVCTLFPAVVNCSSISAPTSGRVSGSGLTYRSVRTFSCNIGYKLGGSTTRTCQADGSWSGTIAICSSKSNGKGK